MSTTGERDVGHPTPEAGATLMRPPAATRDEYIDNYVDTWRILAGPSTSPTSASAHAPPSCTTGATSRSARGVNARRARLRVARRPTARARRTTLVIHGVIDPLVGVTGGRPHGRARTGRGDSSSSTTWGTTSPRVCSANRRCHRPSHVESREPCIMTSGPLSGIKIIEWPASGRARSVRSCSPTWAPTSSRSSRRSGARVATRRLRLRTCSCAAGGRSVST